MDPNRDSYGNELPDNVANILRQLASLTGEHPTAGQPTALDAGRPNESGNELETENPERSSYLHRNMATHSPVPLDLTDAARVHNLTRNQSPFQSVQPPTRNQTTPTSQVTGSLQDHLLQLQRITATANSMPRQLNTPAPQHSLGSSRPATAPSTLQRSIVDPTEIFEWAPALRHVSKLGQQHPEFRLAIEKLIFDQRKNEKDWWNGREQLRASLKVQKQANLDQLDESTHPQIASYDSKIYKAQVDMENFMIMKLKSLGVPFFGVSPDRIITSQHLADVQGKVAEDELNQLQKKMIEYLEAMYAPP